ncbi:MAG: UDP-N-acetylglucosamine 1-carboxyvinyltransferase [Dictyoglomus thermophilum]|uniref:UDP-N-acetylglucosamine 1-carboxyvinyltransferase n=2 Tax=Dictyoglomus thermophilum TaxID=14 RepID=B5YDB9_DICT6|nr:UDP-N-acetylglucosamine 1-carboxyvinyltransferase [Dictyoglomus thermophilum]ACI19808.1 UDP-N-acetylglucosamine 1-carboxyvinyltransferase [Dictyoglomus thermophilum H-6-12]MCX7721345.1 UDP-N-acetylglucosamine 1-carboxyvinyltransferase [Dictyoglomus thermophilum]
MEQNEMIGDLHVRKDKFVIEGGHKLRGEIEIWGSKNASLPIMAASVLNSGDLILDNVPPVKDNITMAEILKFLGMEVEFLGGDRLHIKGEPKGWRAPYELVSKMRASFELMGPLLARFGEAEIPYPGGCRIGLRPVDLHIKGFESLGAEVTVEKGYVCARAKKGLKGTKIHLDKPSVGATRNIMMAAVMAEGETVIENAACEPEVVDLGNFLRMMGAEIEGLGTSTIYIKGKKELKPVDYYKVIPDRIAAGTFIIAGVMLGKDLIIKNVEPEHLQSLFIKLKEAGVESFQIKEREVRVKAAKNWKGIEVTTMPYPGFPTDLQPQMMVFLSLAQGSSLIVETVFENRFLHVGELLRLGAKISIDGRTALIQGVEKLKGAPVEATDLRAGAALVLAGLVAEGITEVLDVGEHIDRGYVALEDKLSSLGAKIKRVYYEESN